MSDEKIVEQSAESAETTSESTKYSLKDAEPVADNIVLKVTNFDQPSTRYYYTPYPADASLLIYGEVVAVEKNNSYRLKIGDHVLYNGSIVYQSLEDGAKYVVAPIKGILLIWRSKRPAQQ
jgi:co-chaperonin GroES (HSP10)